MDTMTYLALKSSGLSKHRIIGMGGTLDSSRFKYYLSQAIGCSPNDLQGFVVGGHGDTTMIPLTRLATYQGYPVSNFLSADALKKVAADTMVGVPHNRFDRHFCMVRSGCIRRGFGRKAF